MSNKTSDTTIFSGNERPAIKWIELPEELAKWAHQNQELVERVQKALSDTHNSLSEDQLWETVAENCSPEWRDAKEDLSLIESQIKDMNSPDKVALGRIGRALDSDQINAVQSRHALSLVHFTMIDEGLRQREDLKNLLSVLLVQKRMLERSAEQTRRLQKAATAFSENAADTRNETQKMRKKDIQHAFRSRAIKLFTPKKDARTAKSAPAPSSTET